MVEGSRKALPRERQRPDLIPLSSNAPLLIFYPHKTFPLKPALFSSAAPSWCTLASLRNVRWSIYIQHGLLLMESVSWFTSRGKDIVSQKTLKCWGSILSKKTVSDSQMCKILWKTLKHLQFSISSTFRMLGLQHWWPFEQINHFQVAKYANYFWKF